MQRDLGLRDKYGSSGKAVQATGNTYLIFNYYYYFKERDLLTPPTYISLPYQSLESFFRARRGSTKPKRRTSRQNGKLWLCWDRRGREDLSDGEKVYSKATAENSLRPTRPPPSPH